MYKRMGVGVASLLLISGMAFAKDKVMKELDAQSFGEFVRGDAVVEFYSPHDRESKRYHRLLEDIAREHTEISFGFVNVDRPGHYEELARPNRVSKLPVTLFYSDGEVCHWDPRTLTVKDLDEIFDKCY